MLLLCVSSRPRRSHYGPAQLRSHYCWANAMASRSKGGQLQADGRLQDMWSVFWGLLLVLVSELRCVFQHDVLRTDVLEIWDEFNDVATLAASLRRPRIWAVVEGGGGAEGGGVCRWNCGPTRRPYNTGRKWQISGTGPQLSDCRLELLWEKPSRLPWFLCIWLEAALYPHAELRRQPIERYGRRLSGEPGAWHSTIPSTPHFPPEDH